MNILRILWVVKSVTFFPSNFTFPIHIFFHVSGFISFYFFRSIIYITIYRVFIRTCALACLPTVRYYDE